MGLREMYAALGQAVQGAPRVEVEGGRLVIERHRGTGRVGLGYLRGI